MLRIERLAQALTPTELALILIARNKKGCQLWQGLVKKAYCSFSKSLDLGSSWNPNYLSFRRRLMQQTQTYKTYGLLSREYNQAYAKTLCFEF